jgi:UDP-3-O-[3-hydroxymyristoyl] glucosamine N-acyltransferase
MHDVADLVGGVVSGDSTLEVIGIAPVDEAGPRQIAFLAATRYARHVPHCRAAAFLVAAELERELPESAIRVVVDDAYPALRTLLRHFVPEEPWSPSVHPSAVVGPGVVMGVGVEVGPYAVLEEGSSVGDGSRIGAHCVVGRRSTVGRGCRLHAHVVLYPDTVLGDGVVVHSGARLGPDGFGYTLVDGRHAKIPQVGRCVIEDDVEIGANATIDRGSLGDTHVGRGVKIDNLVHVGHNVRVGEGSMMAALVGIAGSTRIGRDVWLGGQAGVINQLEVGDGAKITIQTGVTRDVGPGETYSGSPGRPHREELKRLALVGRIPKLLARIEALEDEVSKLLGE